MIFQIPSSDSHAEGDIPVTGSVRIPDPPVRTKPAYAIPLNVAWQGELCADGAEIMWATNDIGKVIRMIYEMEEGDVVVINCIPD